MGQWISTEDQVVFAGGGDQVVFAGGGDQVVFAGGGDQVVFAGGGDRVVFAGGEVQSICVWLVSYTAAVTDLIYQSSKTWVEF